MQFDFQAARKAGAVGEFDVAAKLGGEGFGNGQPKAGAFPRAAGAAVEGVEDACAFFAGDACAAIFDFEQDVPVLRVDAQVDLSACGGVADGVVHEVADEGVEADVVAGDVGVLFAVDADVDVFGVGVDVQFLDDVAVEVLYGVLFALCLFGVLRACHGEQLFEEVAVAADAFAQGVQAFGGFCAHVGFREAFGLQGQGGERRAQFVRGVGDEALLFADAGVYAAEQVVNGGDEAVDFARDVVGGQGGEVGFAAFFELLRELAHGAQRAADGEIGDEGEDGDEEEERGDGVPGAGVGGFFAEFGFLDEGEAALVGVGFEVGAVAFFVVAEVVEAVAQVRVDDAAVATGLADGVTSPNQYTASL